MEKPDYQKAEMLAQEAFLRRASAIDAPFMLKGSYVTRQYFENRQDRIPADLDWVYLTTIHKVAKANEIFSDWAIQVTEMDVDDGVHFVSFRDINFWRRIDYAMAEDFPTVNTDLRCIVNGIEIEFDLDISFNLDDEAQAVPLNYEPINGPSFTIPKTAPISLQLAWKIHQCLVRPRFKDLFDLMHLVNHKSFDKTQRDKAMQALVNECAADKISLKYLKYFLSFDIKKLFPDNSIGPTWDIWRHDKMTPYFKGYLNYENGKRQTDIDLLPEKLEEFLKLFQERLEKGGISMALWAQLPAANRTQRIRLNEEETNTSVDHKSDEKTKEQNQPKAAKTTGTWLTRLFRRMKK